MADQRWVEAAAAYIECTQYWNACQCKTSRCSTSDQTLQLTKACLLGFDLLVPSFFFFSLVDPSFHRQHPLTVLIVSHPFIRTPWFLFCRCAHRTFIKCMRRVVSSSLLSGLLNGAQNGATSMYGCIYFRIQFLSQIKLCMRKHRIALRWNLAWSLERRHLKEPDGFVRPYSSRSLSSLTKVSAACIPVYPPLASYLSCRCSVSPV